MKVLGTYGEDRENIQSKLADLYHSSSSNCLVCISTVSNLGYFLGHQQFLIVTKVRFENTLKENWGLENSVSPL